MDYYIHNGELYHYGVKGMRWGKRKKYYGIGAGGFVPNKPKGRQPTWQYKKTERQKRYEDDNGINPNRPNGTIPKTRVTGKIKSALGDKTVTGARKAADIVSKIGTLYITDQVFFKGAGTEAAKTAIKTMGRATITMAEKARGGYNIHWV